MGHRTLVLDTWGCGAFGNDPAAGAEAFASWLEGSRRRGAFERIVFAVYEPRPPRANSRAFRERLGAG